MTTPEQIAASLSPGAARAVMAMTEWWEPTSYIDPLVRDLVDVAFTDYALCARLNTLGQQVKDALLKIEQETKG